MILFLNTLRMIILPTDRKFNKGIIYEKEILNLFILKSLVF
jgi:hypothetical protein